MAEHSFVSPSLCRWLREYGAVPQNPVGDLISYQVPQPVAHINRALEKFLLTVCVTDDQFGGPGGKRSLLTFEAQVLKLRQSCLLGAVCGSAQSMDSAAQSMDPYFAHESMDRAGQLLAQSMDVAYNTNNVNTVLPRWRRHIYGSIGNLYQHLQPTKQNHRPSA